MSIFDVEVMAALERGSKAGKRNLPCVMAPGGGSNAATGFSCTVGPGRAGGGDSSMRGRCLWPVLGAASGGECDRPAAGEGPDTAADLDPLMAVVDPASGRLPLEGRF